MITSATARRNKPIGRKIHLWKRADMDALRRGYTELATTFCQTSMQQVQFKICGPSLRLIYIISKTNMYIVPSKQSSTRYSQSWINREVKRLSRKKKCSYDKARRTGNAKDLRRYKHLKQLSTEACRRLRTENTGIAPLKDSTGMTQSDGSKKTHILNCQFSSVFNKDEQCDSIPNKGPSPFNDMPAIKIGLEGVYI